jgi:hypothetical protein
MNGHIAVSKIRVEYEHKLCIPEYSDIRYSCLNGNKIATKIATKLQEIARNRNIFSQKFTSAQKAGTSCGAIRTSEARRNSHLAYRANSEANFR